MRRKTISLTVIGILLIFLILYLVNLERVLENLMKLSLAYFFLLLGIQLLTNVLAAVKWRLILRHSQVSMRDLIPAAFVGYFINGITPIGLAGGEPVRAYIISRTSNVPITTAASSVIVDLFIEITPMFLFSGLAIYMVFSNGVPAVIAVFLGLISLSLLVLFCLAVTLMLNRRFSIKFIRKLIRLMSKLPFLRKHLKEVLPEVEHIGKSFNDAIRLHMLDGYIFFLGTFVSFLAWMLRFLRTYLIFVALGASLDFTTVLVVETAVSALSFIPLLPGSLGIWEGASIALYTLMAQPPIGEAAAAAATVLNRFYMFLFPLVLGFAAAVYLGLNIQRITNSEDFIEK